MHTHIVLHLRRPSYFGFGGEEINITIFTRHSMANAIRKGKMEY